MINPFDGNLEMHSLEELRTYRLEHAISMHPAMFLSIEEVIAKKEAAELEKVARVIAGEQGDETKWQEFTSAAQAAIKAVRSSSREEPVVKNTTEQFGECGRYRILAGEHTGLWACDKCFTRWDPAFHGTHCPHDKSPEAQADHAQAQANAMAIWFPDHVKK